MNKRLLAIFAHPDDEAFGPGGTLARYANEGVEVHLLSATRGETGEWDEELKSKLQNPNSKINNKIKIHHLREKELLSSSKILGIAKVEFLNFIDGQLSNSDYHNLTGKIIKKINDFKPQVILTFDRLGVSGHLDHIAVSMTTTYSYLKTDKSFKLYYQCLPKKWYNKRMEDYFIYFPEGYSDGEITTKIDYSKYWQVKKKAMKQHKSQMVDVKVLLKQFESWPKIDHFILQFHRKIKTTLPETDLFDGIK